MCGIAGGIRHVLSDKEAAQVLGRLRHRGPDDNGLWRDEAVWLANTRLAIQDLSPAGAQPMRSEDKNYIIVYNGELYNAPELRRRLEDKGAAFYTSCDTEVLLNAYAEWGADCLNELDGDFAFAVWNAGKKELFLARDPAGVKPLYIYDDGRQLLFASEIKALLNLDSLDYSLKPEVFYDYLTYLYSPSSATPFQYIRKLLPGHCLQLSINDWDTEPIPYHATAFKIDDAKTDGYWSAALEQTLASVVQRQLYSDAPVGLMLSGGLDSGLIAALARKTRPDLPLQAFCINTGGAMKNDGFDDDIIYARQLADQLKIPLHEIDGMCLPDGSWIDKIVWDLDEPQADPAAWYTGAIASAARVQGIKVLLSGTGGDDVFSGYRRHQAIPLLKLMPFLPKGIAALPKALQRCLPHDSAMLRRMAKLLSTAGMSARHAAIHSHFWTPPDKARRLLAAPHRKSAGPFVLFESLLARLPDETDLLQQMLALEQQAFLPHHNLAYMDKMGMAHSVEVRVPFADRHVVALAAAMPSGLKIKGNTTKAILREAAETYLPKAIIRRRKTGFGAPLRSWMRGPLQPLLRERLTDNSFLQRAIFDRAAIREIIQASEHGGKGDDDAYTLFSLLCIESWLRQFA